MQGLKITLVSRVYTQDIRQCHFMLYKMLQGNMAEKQKRYRKGKEGFRKIKATWKSRPIPASFKRLWLFKTRLTSIICLLWYYYQHIMDTECNILFIQSLSSHEHLHLIVQRKRSIVFSEAVEQFDILEFLMLITDWNVKYEKKIFT